MAQYKNNSTYMQFLQKYNTYLNKFNHYDKYKMSEEEEKNAELSPEYGIKLVEYMDKYNSSSDENVRKSVEGDIASLNERFYSDMNKSSADGNTPPESDAENPGTDGKAYERLLNDELNRYGKTEFSYAPEQDEAYNSYRKEYLREGKRAAESALASAASATGGIPSSYAVTASSQAADYYASKLADKIPELYENAYKRYLDGNTSALEYIKALSDIAESTEKLDSDRKAREAELALSKLKYESSLAQDEKSKADKETEKELETRRDEIIKRWKVSGLPLTREESEITGYPTEYSYSEYVRNVNDAESADGTVSDGKNVTYKHYYSTGEIQSLRQLCLTDAQTAFNIWDKIYSDAGEENALTVISKTIDNSKYLFGLFREWQEKTGHYFGEDGPASDDSED